ncbi:hypothetical protein [uncultured Pontibacter sp.]|uniref:hypothetical protein n=1 Tax=uncultured Pontibacter sp. TaxID=453356 RepID=UPI00262F144F|nr:hypothetical protein [uncultured Pontibacter sp.]
MCNVTPVNVLPCKWLSSLLVTLVLAASPALAQIDQKSENDHKHERKKFLKEANKEEAQYKDTHLNVNTYTFKVGEVGRKRAKKDERAQYQFNDAGEPVVKKRLFSKKKKKQRRN